MRRKMMFVLALLSGSVGGSAQQQPQLQQPRMTELGRLPDIEAEYVAVSPDERLYMVADGSALYVFDRASRRTTKVADGDFWEVTWSPKGNLIAFSRSNEAGSADQIWTMPVDTRTGLATGPPRRVSQRIGGKPLFSPDGAWIAFAANRVPNGPGQDLTIVPSNGGPERVLTSEPEGVSARGFTPDGRTVYYEARESRAAQNWLFKRVSVDGGEPQVLGSGRGLYPGLSPDGRFMAINAPQGRVLADSDGRNIARFQLPGVYGEAWNQRSTGIVAGFVERTHSLMVLPLQPNAQPRALPASSGKAFPSFSPDGRRIASYDSAQAVIIANADGSSPRTYRSTRPLFVLGAGSALHAISWSPDGRMLAVRVAGSQGIDVIDVTSGQARALVTPPAGHTAQQFTWREDGQALRYILRDNVNFTVREATLAGGDREVRLLGAHQANMGVVFADYNRVVTGAASTHDPRRLIDLQSGAARVLDFPANARSKPTISPDGRWLALTISTTGGFRDALRVVSTETGEGRTIRLGFNDGENSNQITGPVWHPDSKRVFLIGTPPNANASRIYSVSLNGEGIRQLYTPAPGSFARTIDISPDGRTLMYSLIGSPKARLVEFDLTPLINAAAPVRR